MNKQKSEVSKKRDKNKCPNNAGFIVPWGGKILKLCHVHANGMAVLGNVIGSPVQVEPIITFEQCQGENDLDEYKPKEKGGNSSQE
jgi:hypothetical protein